MAITNQQAMAELKEAQAKINDAESAYWRGIFVGMCNAYWTVEVITFDQYKALLGIESVPA